MPIRPCERGRFLARALRDVRLDRRVSTGTPRPHRPRLIPTPAARLSIQALVLTARPFSSLAVRGKRMSAVMNATETDVETETKQMLKDGGVTVEYQRRKAKEMVKFFKQQAYDQAVEDSQVFGWTPKNEINNGRWTMFGLLVGMMTEYATGVDFIDQVKLTVSVLGIADIYD